MSGWPTALKSQQLNTIEIYFLFTEESNVDIYQVLPGVGVQALLSCDPPPPTRTPQTIPGLTDGVEGAQRAMQGVFLSQHWKRGTSLMPMGPWAAGKGTISWPHLSAEKVGRCSRVGVWEEDGCDGCDEGKTRPVDRESAGTDSHWTAAWGR